MKRKMMCILFALTLLIQALPIMPYAAGIADDITSQTYIETTGFEYTDRLSDKAEYKSAVTENGGSITLSGSLSIGSVYIVFNTEPTEWELSANGKVISCGKNGFLHEYVDMETQTGSAEKCILTFKGAYEICEIYVLSSGTRPDWVQVWEPTLERSDLLLFVSHSDDDQLFFAGLIPLYTALGYDVQVAYLTYHKENIRRRHELLNGLWVAGARNYPVYGKFDDFRIDDLQETIDEYKRRNTSYSDIESYVIETIRKIKPLVIATHDTNGEYGHGMHRMLSQMVCNSASICPDELKYPESAKKYGVWCPNKIYVHLYNKNKIILDIDKPLDELGGKTPFEMSQQAFLKHVTQLDTWFYPWLSGTADAPITSSTQIRKYNPAYYGLYYTSVGADTEKNDMFEHIMTYREQDEFFERLDRLEADITASENKANSVQKDAEELENEIAAVKKAQNDIVKLQNEKNELKEKIAIIKSETHEAVMNYPENNDTVVVTVMLGITVFIASFVFVLILITFIPSKRKNIDVGSDVKSDNVK